MDNTLFQVLSHHTINVGTDFLCVGFEIVACTVVHTNNSPVSARVTIHSTDKCFQFSPMLASLIICGVSIENY